MNKTQFSKHPLLTGTLLLTLAGLISRIIGFFYRIFLSHTIGAEGLGIYQLIFPIYALMFALTVAGIQSAISKFVAEATAYSGNSSGHRPGAFTYLYAGLSLSLLLSFLCTFLLYKHAGFIAITFLGEPRCTPLLKILALTAPFGAIHSCINGYFYGLQKTFVPATSQFFEQIARVGGVFLIYHITIEQGRPVTVDMAVWGLVIGEIASVLSCISVTHLQKNRKHFGTALNQIFFMALPLTTSRVMVNLLQSMEAILIPGKLREFGYASSEALSVYGVLTGMAMPMILFPSAITNSVSVMLLPAISEAQAKKDITYIKNAIKKSCFYCITLGLACTLGFLLFGKWIGYFVYANELAGTLIVILGWICPFLYLTTTLSSILNGLGKTTLTFIINILGCGIRILFIIFLIPSLGIRAYLWGMLVSHLFMAAWAIFLLFQIVFREGNQKKL